MIKRHRRILSRVIVFLLLGAIMNVAVAWGCPLFTDSIGCEVLTFETRDSRSSTGLARVQFVQTGWPLYTLDGEEVFGVPHFGVPVLGTRISSRGAISFRGPNTLLLPYLVEFLPIAPLWPGFAINTIFYAAALWMVFSLPFVVRRRRRIKRGLCPACAYPIGTSPVCTECGAALPIIFQGIPR